MKEKWIVHKRFDGKTDDFLDEHGNWKPVRISIRLDEPSVSYARPLPKEIDIYKNTITKHYLDWKRDIQEGSIRVVKPAKGVLVYLGCLVTDKWDPKTRTCSPKPTIVKSIVPRTEKYERELEHLRSIHPEIKVVDKSKVEGIEAKEPDPEFEAVKDAMNHAEEVSENG